MSYVKTAWINGETPLNADNMNKIENGIQNNEAVTSAVSDSLKTLSATVTQNAQRGSANESKINKINSVDLPTKQNKSDTSLETTSKTVVGAINEINKKPIGTVVKVGGVYKNEVLFTTDPQAQIGSNTLAITNIMESQLPKKQDKLIAGSNITIKNNVISSSGGGVPVEQFVLVDIDPIEPDGYIDLNEATYEHIINNLPFVVLRCNDTLYYFSKDDVEHITFYTTYGDPEENVIVCDVLEILKFDMSCSRLLYKSLDMVDVNKSIDTKINNAITQAINEVY